MRKIFLTTCVVLLSFPGWSQQKKSKKPTGKAAAPVIKKPLNHNVYDFWQDNTERFVSNDGRFFVYGQNPQEGDGKIVIREISNARIDSVPRGSGARITADSEFALFKIKPQLNLVKDAKRAKKKKEELPKDSLAIYNLKARTVQKIPGVSSFKVPEKAGSWVAYQLEAVVPPKEKKDTTAKALKPAKAPKKESEENGYKLIVQDLKTGKLETFAYVKEYEVSEDGKWLAFATAGNDSTLKAGVYVWEAGANALKLIHEGLSKHKFSKLAFAKTTGQLAFIADADTNSKTQVRLPKLYYWNQPAEKATLIADETNQPGVSGWLVSANYAPEFSRDGTKLYFGTNPKPVVADTTLLPDEIVNVEVWHWQDKNLQTRQKVTLEQDKKRSHLAIYHTDSKKLVQLGNENLTRTQLVNEGNADFVLATSDGKYSHEHWDWNPKQDVYIINSQDGSEKLLKEKLEGNVRMSPEGKYAYWFSNPDTAWFAYDVAKGQTIQLTDNKTVNFADELDDHPDFPNPYGLAGWTKGDESALINDRYDIWEVSPSAPQKIRKLTNGRPDKREFRYVTLDRDERNIDMAKPLLLSSVHEITKQQGYYRLNTANTTIARLYEGDFKTGYGVLKAKNGEQLFFTKETFQNYPDWYVADPDFKSVTKITTTNPQQDQYSWGSVELVSWLAGDGTPLQGLLYKPENFDPAKKYPMMVYYYEKNTENLHSHFAPKPIRSYINFSYFTSNGYIVFVPDIVYKIGYPGQSAYNCLIPGVLSQIDKGFVDRDRIGISGHSWGGYQTAYLVTQTDLFRAAEAGAPVSNMTSAYGGIRWDTGLTRQAQYEKTQSRIGGTLWEKPMQYIENSPLFYAPKVNTPLLMMHNDEDGAVPWYQGIEYYMALKRLGKPVWMLNYNGEKHGLGKRQNMKDFAVRMYQYFDYYLKDGPLPSWLGEGLPYVEKGINQHLEPMKK
ncbi:S9 family peptidase [Dyadobacter sp. CY312]|uniref:alpha/beta hydrolase family protein n=1 Tax=Dyadobacter sp. CY312 TaxID=2907303 RepID=UPI001F1CF5B3|nr:prolyl oligopeptidase family serine peptidase [Dyadobacter sp. CY312]MCE7038840.1 prolyl oligopeptidase family serine peptidase [Dyadobacter sp. CY312]